MRALLGLILLASLSTAELLGVQILFRHGDRMSAHFMYLPTDTPADHTPWPYERGDLTNIGAKQLYELGQRLRTEVYPLLFNQKTKIKTSQVHIWTGSDNRTSASGLAFTTGFFPDYQAPNEAPFGMHANPVLDKISFAIITDDDCTQLSPSIKRSSEYKKMMQQWAPLMEYMSNKTTVPLRDFHEMGWILDNLYVRTVYNRSIPNWAHEGLLSNVTNYVDISGEAVFQLFSLPAARPTVTGFMMGQFVPELVDQSNNRTNHKIALYSGHDSNIIAAILGMGVEDQVNTKANPHYGANLHIRLLGTPGQPETHYVEVYYAPDWEAPLQQLELAKCPSKPCSVKDFANLVKPVSTVEYIARCKGGNALIRVNDPRHGSMLALEIIAAVLATLWVATGIAYIVQRRATHNAQAAEQQRLLDSHLQPTYT